MPSYQTIKTSYQAEIEIKRSRFIANLVPISDFEAVLNELRQTHKKASHHVTAFRQMQDNNQIIEQCRDDGEPSGTSGMPVLKVLQSANFIDVGVIVTRYFGGTKLGTGGLSRAYSGAAKEVLEHAQLTPWQRRITKHFNISFSALPEFENLVQASTLNVQSREYNEVLVTFTLEGNEEDVEAFTSAYDAHLLASGRG